jgi:hypothetical protein
MATNQRLADWAQGKQPGREKAPNGASQGVEHVYVRDDFLPPSGDAAVIVEVPAEDQAPAATPASSAS